MHGCSSDQKACRHGAAAARRARTLQLPLCLLQGVRCDAVVESAHSVPGAGMVATVDGRHVAAGNAALLATQGLTGPEVTAAQRAIDAEGEPCLLQPDLGAAVQRLALASCKVAVGSKHTSARHLVPTAAACPAVPCRRHRLLCGGGWSACGLAQVCARILHRTASQCAAAQALRTATGSRLWACMLYACMLAVDPATQRPQPPLSH